MASLEELIVSSMIDRCLDCGRWYICEGKDFKIKGQCPWGDREK